MNAQEFAALHEQLFQLCLKAAEITEARLGVPATPGNPMDAELEQWKKRAETAEREAAGWAIRANEYEVSAQNAKRARGNDQDVIRGLEAEIERMREQGAQSTVTIDGITFNKVAMKRAEELSRKAFYEAIEAYKKVTP